MGLALSIAHDGIAKDLEGEDTLESRVAIEAFLREVETRAFRIAVMNVRDRDEALDIVQDCMIRLDQVLAQDAMRALEQALPMLPPRQREAFTLRNFEGLDVAQTAVAMNCTEGSVKTHYSRAVHRLRELLREHGEEHWYEEDKRAAD